MDNNKIIIILLIIIIAILAVGISALALQGQGKEECKIKISLNETMYDGDSVKIKLTDLNKTPIVNETISVKLSTGDDIQEYNLTTNKNGIATLKLNDLSEGKYKLNCTFDGNDKYLPTNASKNFKFKEETVASSNTNSIDANRPTNDINYKGYTPYHESEITSDGWNPREHEVSRQSMPDGSTKIRYDDGYFRLVDDNGYVITYGYG
jgi:hypothetical protein